MEINVFDSDNDEEIRFRINQFRRPKIFKERINYFNYLSEEDFSKRFRLSKISCRNILELIKDDIIRINQNNAISLETKLLLTLRFYATGAMLLAMTDFFGVSKTSAYTIVKEVTYAIAGISRQYIYMPRNHREVLTNKQKFYGIARFPNVIGAIDCTHIKIQSIGGENAELYRNRKGYFSWNVQVVGDVDLRIRDIVARWPGATHDQTIFNGSRVKVRFENGEFRNSILLGDSGYGVRKFLLTPLFNPHTPLENLYNESQIRTRNVIERLFGVWKRRFPIISNGMRVNPSLSKAIIVATAVLHNFAIDERDEGIFQLNDIFMEHPVPQGNQNNEYRNYLVNVYFANL